MLARRRKIVVAVLLVCAAAFVLGDQVRSSALGQIRTEPRMAAATPGGAALKLEGAWVARVTDVSQSPFPPGLYQWSYIVAPSANGRSAALHGTVDASFPGNLVPSDYESPLLGQEVVTAPDTVAFNSQWFYFLKGQVTGIGRSSGYALVLAPDKIEVHHHFQIYVTAGKYNADKDGDGIIDPDATAVAEFYITSVDTRLPGPKL